MVTLAGSLLGDSVFLLPLLLCHHMALGGQCFTDSWDRHLFRVLPFALAAAWRSQSSVSLPTCVCMQTVNERCARQQTGPLVPSSHSGAIWGSSDPSEISAEACVVTRNWYDVRVSLGDVFKTDEADSPDGVRYFLAPSPQSGTSSESPVQFPDSHRNCSYCSEVREYWVWYFLSEHSGGTVSLPFHRGVMRKHVQAARALGVAFM